MARPSWLKRRRRSMAVKRRGLGQRLLLALGVFCVCLLGWGSWQGLRQLLSSESLSLRELRIEGCRVLPEQRVRERLEPLLGRPLFSIDPDSLEAALTDLPRVESIRVSRRPPGTLRCRISEATAVALWFDEHFVEIDAIRLDEILLEPIQEAVEAANRFVAGARPP